MEGSPRSAIFVGSESYDGRESTKSQNSGGQLHNDSFIYREDVVKSNKQEGMLGVVMEVPGDSDSDSDSSTSDESDYDESGNGAADGNENGTISTDDTGEQNDCSADGQVSVMWLDGSETTTNLGDISVVDRGFLHGDIVSSVAEPTGQLGLVVNANILVDLLSPIGELIRNVSSQDLKRFREFTVGDYVVHGPWLGRVDDMVENVTVLFDDGSLCKVMKADPSRLKPVSKSMADDTGCPYYPGQRVRAISSSVFRGSRWLSGLWKANRLEGTVTKVQAGSVFIYWIASSNPGEGSNRDTVPSQEQNPKDLTLLSCFSHANWRLGEWCLFSGARAKGIGSPIEGCDSNPDQNENDSVGKNGSVTNEHEDLVSHHNEKNLKRNKVPDEEDGPVKCNQFRTSGNVSEVSNKDNNVCLEGYNIESDSCTTASTFMKEPSRESWTAYRKKLRKVFFRREKKGHRRDDHYEKAFLIVNIKTMVDVTWQDGTRKLGLDSNSLIPINNPGDQEFFPEQYVIEKTLNENDCASEVKRVGVAKSMMAKERIACIRWLKPVSRPEDPREFDKEEMVSAYELDLHPDYDYCYGDVVVRLSPVSVSSSSSMSETPTVEQEGQTNLTKENSRINQNIACFDVEQGSNGDPHIDASDLSWVGHITGLEEGDIEVTWGDGMVSKVGPQAIYVVGREDDEESFDGGSEYNDGASWETVEENELCTLDTGEEETVAHTTTSSCIDEEGRTGSHSEDFVAQNGPLSSAISFVTNLASGIFSHGRKQMDTELQENFAFSENVTTVDESSSREHVTPDCHGIDSSSATTAVCSSMPVYTDVQVNDSTRHMENETCVVVNGADNRDDSISFKHFDITENPLDHNFLGGSGQSNCEKKWVKKVQQEWSILEKNLPDAIYVRVFEDRMDLLRAVIVGACGTPYQDGLFFFDFQLPSEYPQVPPFVHYHSGGLRVNPNLYENGKVCLSLLNTWTGKGNEVWDPSSSSILQVLVSIQGLVLNSKPYFNEAGYEKQIGTVEGEKNYLPYNENIFLLNLKSMMYLLRRPPMHFEEFVKGHFRQRGYYILKACDAYMRGCMVGSLTKDACESDTSSEDSCSIGFKLMLKKIIPRLFSSLSEVGADCKPYEYLVES